jgi:hypothetical protein
MIKDPTLNYWTDKERDLYNSLKKECDEIRGKGGSTSKEDAERLRTLEDKKAALQEKKFKAYCKSFQRKPRRIFDDAKEIINSINKEDYTKVVDNWRNLSKELGMDLNAFTRHDIFFFKTFESCVRFIDYHVTLQRFAIAHYHIKDGNKKLDDMIEARAATWYETEPKYFKAWTGKPIKALTILNKNNIEPNEITGNGTATINEVTFLIEKFVNNPNISITADKLLSYALVLFTMQNDINTFKKLGRMNTAVYFPLKDFTKQIGRDPEKKSDLDRTRRQVKKALNELIYKLITWQEFINGKEEHFDKVRVVQRAFFKKGGIIFIRFSEDIGEYLITRNIITPISTKLLKLDSRSDTAYRIGRKLISYYNIDRNILRGTNDRISVPALIKSSGLPSYSELQSKGTAGHWEQQIKEPMEKAFDTLTQKEIIKDWEYVHAKAKKLTDVEAGQIDSYNKFANCYILYKPVDEIDHAKRLAAKSKRKDKRAK